MDKLVKISIIVASLLAGSGIFYHFVVYLPDLERQKVQRERAEIEEAARRAEAEKREAAKRAEAEKLEAARRAEAERLEAAKRAAIQAATQRQQAAEAEKRARMKALEAEARKLERQSAYYGCLVSAEGSYKANWANECKAQARRRETSLRNCLENPNIVNNQFMGARWCHSTYGGADPSPQCSLPTSLADSIEKNLEKAKQQCLAEAKLFQ